MEKHTRFHIDLDPDDAKLLNKLTLHLSNKRKEIVIRAEVMRFALRTLAARERV